MAHRDTEIGLMLRANPGKAKARLLKVFAKHGGNSTYVAKALGVNVATVKRWIGKCGDEFRQQIQAMRDDAKDEEKAA